jgi:hypothetical protein
MARMGEKAWYVDDADGADCADDGFGERENSVFAQHAFCADTVVVSLIWLPSRVRTSGVGRLTAATAAKGES